MRLSLSALLLLSWGTYAAPLAPTLLPAVSLAQTPVSPPPSAPSPRPSQVEDDEDDEEEGTDEERPAGAEQNGAAASPPTPSSAPPAGGEDPQPSAATTAAAPDSSDDAPDLRPLTPAQKARQQQLVSGAPLYNPNVAVHIVEKKQFSDASKSELAFYPVAPQVNGKFVQHTGTALSYTYHVNENFGLQVTPQYNWHNKEAGFNQELVDKVSQLPQAASALLFVGSLTAGVEIAPFYGKFAFYQGSLAHFSFVVNGGAGVGATRTQIRGRVEADGVVVPPSYGDTGLRFIGSVGAGFRVQIGDRFALRLEARDLVYSAQVSSVNGCSEADLEALELFTTSNDRPLSEASVSGGCNVSRFEGREEGTGHDRQRDLPLALGLVRQPSSDVLNNLGFYTGFSFLF